MLSKLTAHYAAAAAGKAAAALCFWVAVAVFRLCVYVLPWYGEGVKKQANKRQLKKRKKKWKKNQWSAKESEAATLMFSGFINSQPLWQ